MTSKKLLSCILAAAMSVTTVPIVTAAADTPTNTLTDQQDGSESGQLTITLKIKQTIEPTVTLADWQYKGTPSTPEVTGNSGNGEVTYKYKVKGADDSTYTKTVPTAQGSYTVKAEIAETEEYKAGSATADFEIKPMTKGLTITLVIKPKVSDATVTMEDNSADVKSVVLDDKTLTEGTDYTVSYKQGETVLDAKPTASGEYTAVITGKGDYDGEITKDFTLHVHSYSEEWEKDATQHWHKCIETIGTCDGTKKDVAAHVYGRTGDARFTCSVCGYVDTDKQAAAIAADNLTAASNVDALITAIGTVTYTDACKAKIDEARAAYDALSKAQQSLVTKLSTLKNAEGIYATLESNSKAAQAVDEKIAAIGTVTYTDACKAKIDEARAEYDALSKAQQSLVTKLTVLKKAESDYATLKADNEAAQAVDTKITAIGKVEYTDACKAKIDKARAEYEALTESQKVFVTKLAALEKAENDYAELKVAADKAAADAVIAKINAIGDIENTAECKALIDDARTAYNDLTEDQKKLVNNYIALTYAEKLYDALVGKKEAEDTAAQALADKATAEAAQKTAEEKQAAAEAAQAESEKIAKEANEKAAAAETAKKAAEEALAKGEKDAAAKVKAAEAAQKAAEEAQAEAEQTAKEAEAKATAAETAQKAAEKAQATAEQTAKKAEAKATAAEKAQKAAEEALANVENDAAAKIAAAEAAQAESEKIAKEAEEKAAAAETAQKAAEEALAKGEKDAAAKVKAAEAAQKATEEAQAEAEQAAKDAEAKAAIAEEAQKAAEEALANVENDAAAKIAAAEAAQKTAEEKQAAAEKAQAESEKAAKEAAEKAAAAETAQKAAEEALAKGEKDAAAKVKAAEAAQKAAEEAQEEAEKAASQAQADQAAAEKALAEAENAAKTAEAEAEQAIADKEKAESDLNDANKTIETLKKELEEALEKLKNPETPDDPETGIIGDANQDNKLNIMDASFIAKKLAQKKSDELPEIADFNKDGNKNVLDARAIASYLANRKSGDNENSATTAPDESQNDTSVTTVATAID